MNAPSGIFGDEAAELPLASLKRLARIAGVFYLVVAMTGGFSEGSVDPPIYVAGDAAGTAANVLNNASLMRLGVVAHLTDAVFLPLTALTLYLLLQHAGKHAARLMVVAVIIAAGIKSVDAVFSYVALNVATDSSYETAPGLLGSSAIVLILLDIQHYAVLAAQVFFALWLAPLGYLAIKSRLFPQDPGHHPHPGHPQLPGADRTGVPAAPARSADPQPSGHPAPRRRSLDALLPAHHRRPHASHGKPHPCTSGTSTGLTTGSHDWLRAWLVNSCSGPDT